MSVQDEIVKAFKGEAIRFRVGLIRHSSVSYMTGGGPDMTWYPGPDGAPYVADEAEDAQSIAAVLNAATTDEHGVPSGFAVVCPYAEKAGQTARRLLQP